MNVTEVYNAYWQFAYQRQEVFFNRLFNHKPPWTEDKVIQKYKFTNAYRVTDRVSQYLVRNVIYSKQNFSAEDTIFRILLYKFFNKIETWEALEKELGEISYKCFKKDAYIKILNKQIADKKKIYSAAYIIPSGVSAFGHIKKHRNTLDLLEYIMNSGVSRKIADVKSLQALYDLFKSYPTIGSFLAFQYAIDINYSELTDFSEMSFVVAGPGAKRGIEKCFGALKHSYEYYIEYMANNQHLEFKRNHLNFKYLFGRQLQLIDCQNLFCEVDKYSRVVFPEIICNENRVKIKQVFKSNGDLPPLFLPPKWGLKY